MKQLTGVLLTLMLILWGVLWGDGTLSAAYALETDWGYSDTNGAKVWSKLNPEYRLCGAGAAQSPIDLDELLSKDGLDEDLQSQDVNSQDANSHSIQFHYGTLGLTPSLKQMELHRRLQISAPVGNTLDFDQNSYQLVQFHVHSPSEHQIHHHSAAAELHFVHRNDHGQTLVVAVLLEPGSENPVFESLLNVSPTDPAINSDKVLETALDTSPNLPSKLSSKLSPNPSLPSLDLTALLPATAAHYEYIGSLTTPPCTEGVQWIVLRSPITLSPQQIEQLHNYVDHNNRPLQPLNHRFILGQRPELLSEHLSA